MGGTRSASVDTLAGRVLFCELAIGVLEDTAIIRRAGVLDLALLLEAQAASEFEVTPLDANQVAAGLFTGAIEAYILERQGSVMVLAVQAEGEEAMLCCWWRRGPAQGLRSESNEMLAHVREELDRRGVKRMYCCVSKRNRRHDKLIAFYRRLGLEPDMTRLGGKV